MLGAFVLLGTCVPPPVIWGADGECRGYESAGTNLVGANGAGTVTSILTASWTGAEAGSYYAQASYTISVSRAGSTELMVEGSLLDSVGSHGTGARFIQGAFTFAGGDLDVELRHVSENVGTVTYGENNDVKWSRRILVCFMGTDTGGGGSGVPGPTGPPGATGPPCGSVGSECPVEITTVSGQALDVAQLAIFGVVFIGGLVVLMLAWLAIQGLRR